MGLDDSYRLPERYNDAYHVCGDGVCAPVVRHIAETILEPILAASHAKALSGGGMTKQLRSRRLVCGLRGVLGDAIAARRLR